MHSVEKSSDSDCVQVDEETHVYFNSVELGSVATSLSTNKGMINVTINNHDVKIKAGTGAEANVIPFGLYQRIARRPLQKIHQPLKGWLATKTIHPVGCVRLQTRYKHRLIDLLYLVVQGDFTPLLSCDACLVLEVLRYMNLDVIHCKPIVPETEGSPNTFPDLITRPSTNAFSRLFQ